MLKYNKIFFGVIFMKDFPRKIAAVGLALSIASSATALGAADNPADMLSGFVCHDAVSSFAVPPYGFPVERPPYGFPDCDIPCPEYGFPYCDLPVPEYGFPYCDLPVPDYGFPADFILGDVTGTGKVTSADATALARWLVAPPEVQQQMIDDETFCKLAADINGDGVVDVADLTMLVRKLVGLSVEN